MEKTKQKGIMSIRCWQRSNQVHSEESIDPLEHRHTHDGMAAVQREGVLESLATLRPELISAVNHPAVSLHQDGRSEVLVRVPPVRGAGSRAASAKNALVKTIQLLAILDRLQVLKFRLRGLLLQEGLDRLVLSVELGQIRNEVLDNICYIRRVTMVTGVPLITRI